MAKARVVVLGAGFAGLETAFYLRHTLHDKVDLTLVADRDYFLFKPNTIYIPFGEDPEKFKIPLDEAIRRKNTPELPAASPARTGSPTSRRN